RRRPSAVRVKRGAGGVAPLIAPVVATVLPERLAERWRQFAGGNGKIDAAYRTQRGLFMPRELEQVAGPAIRDRWATATSRLAESEAALFRGAASTLEGDVARLETRAYLGAQLLRDTDVMSMAHGLEVRVPFVDHELLAAVWPDLGAFPALMRNKRLLHETLARPLPPDAVDRPKQGFTLPFATWMERALQPFVRDGPACLEERRWIAAGTGAPRWGGSGGVAGAGCGMAGSAAARTGAVRGRSACSVSFSIRWARQRNRHEPAAGADAPRCWRGEASPPAVGRSGRVAPRVPDGGANAALHARRDCPRAVHAAVLRPVVALSAVGRHLRARLAGVHDERSGAADSRLRGQPGPGVAVLQALLSGAAHHGLRGRSVDRRAPRPQPPRQRRR